MQPSLEQLVAAFQCAGTWGPETLAACRQHAQSLKSASTSELEQVLEALLSWLDAPHGSPKPAGGTELDELLSAVLEPLWQRYPPGKTSSRAEPFSRRAIEQIAELYGRLKTSRGARQQLLRSLAAEASPAALGTFAELVASDPHERADDAGLAFVPLLQNRTLPAAALFPRLLDALEHPAVAPLVLDVANHLTRRKLLPLHPAASRLASLATLFGGLVEHLGKLQEQPALFGTSPGEVQQRIADSIALLVPLCDALALIGDPSVVGKLYQALGLEHRRLRTEAAAALARLGEEAGVDALAQLAAEPVVRPVVLAYLEELGRLEQVTELYRTPEARAEGDLARWLAQPNRFGLPPHELELIDACRQYWPGFDEPVDCFLFRYEYRLPQGEFSGVGIGAPVTFSVYCDLQDLPPSDIYAVYAGWSAEHEEMSETDAERLSPEQQQAWHNLRARLEQLGYTDLRLARLGHFFSQDVPVAWGSRAGQPGILVVDDGDVLWLPTGGSSRPLGPSEAYDLFKGRKILETFNAGSRR